MKHHYRLSSCFSEFVNLTIEAETGAELEVAIKEFALEAEIAPIFVEITQLCGC